MYRKINCKVYNCLGHKPWTKQNNTSSTNMMQSLDNNMSHEYKYISTPILHYTSSHMQVIFQICYIILWYRVMWTWWRNQLEKFSALLVLWEGNPPVTSEPATAGFTSQRPVTRSFDVFYPRPVLAFGYCRCLRLSVCVCVCLCVCPSTPSLSAP